MTLRPFRLSALAAIAVLVMACGSPTPAPTAPPAKPAEQAKPAEPAKPTEAAKPAEVAKPAAAAASPAAAQPGAAPAGPADVADVDAAKKDGGVTWYTSTPLRQAQTVATAFEAKYGIKVEVFRSGGEQVIQRFLAEVSAGRVVADLLTASDPAAFNEMVRKNQLVKFRPANSDKVPAGSRQEDGYWVAQRLNLITLAYRTDKEQAADMPKSWRDAADPKYKGKLVHADPSFTAIASQLVTILSRDLGWSYYEALKKNDMMIVQGHQQLAQILSTGERTIAAEAGDSDMWDLKKKGIPITSVYPTDGVFVIPAPTGVVAGSPHPAAARLLAEYMLSDEAQKLFPAEGYYAARTDMPPPEGNPPLGSLKIIPVDNAYLDQNAEKSKQKFGEIFSN